MASVLYTRAQIRDAVRRMLQQAVLFDQGLGPPGAQNPQFPTPTNAQLNMAMDMAADDIVLYSGFHSQFVDLPFTSANLPPSTTTTGPAQIPLSSPTPPAGNNTVIEVRNVEWQGSDGQNIHLQPASYQTWNINRFDWRIQAPANPPQFFFVENYNLYILPWPTITGQFEVLATTGLTGFINDTDTIDGIPASFQNCEIDRTLVRVAQMNTLDVEMMDRAKVAQSDYLFNVQKLKEWMDTRNYGWMPGAGLETYRDSYGTQRVRR